MLSDRKQQILGLIVENFIATAEPVGSKFLVEKANLGVSGATIRNEMRELEELGYLNHPHTSAGRVPTEEGYKFYIKNIMKPVLPKKKVQTELQQIRKQEKERLAQLKSLAKYLSHYMGGAVIVSSQNEDTLYYTGLSNLFSQPEFHDYAHTVGMSAIFDEVEHYMNDLMDHVEAQSSSVVVGSKNPLGKDVGTVVLEVDGDVIAVVGPMRMPYRSTIGILEFIRNLE